jgi:hypothetical protein
LQVSEQRLSIDQGSPHAKPKTRIPRKGAKNTRNEFNSIFQVDRISRKAKNGERSRKGAKNTRKN